MTIATISSKGQITIPKPIRALMQLEAGDKVSFILLENGQVILRPISLKVDDVIGFLYEPGRKSATVKEMDESITSYVSERMNAC